MLVRKNVYLILLLFVAVLAALLFNKFTSVPFLTFSDGAKFADIARNLVQGKGYGSSFRFFSPPVPTTETGLYSTPYVSPLMPLAIALGFLLLGVSDSTVVVVSTIFFVGTIILIYLLGKRLFGEKVGILSALAVCFNVSFLSYASTGASESLFVFEILLAMYLFVLRKRWANVFGLTVLILMYFTKAQSVIYILGFLLLYFLLNYPLKNAIKYFVGVFIIGSLGYIAISYQGVFAITQILPGISSSEPLRGAVQSVNLIAIVKKLFYNLYNLYKLLPQIASPYMWALFAIGLLKWGKDRVGNSLKASTLFMVVATFILTALTVPLFRYLHPVVPLVYLIAVATTVWIAEQLLKTKRMVALVSFLLIFIFSIGQTLGVIFLDSRFQAERVNSDKPPVYTKLSWELKDNTSPNYTVLTNLDTWGSWYGERKTIWYPLKPEQLSNLSERIDAIYLTSYLIDDENYYMGTEWRQIFENPKNIKDKYIADNYKFAKEFSISSEDTYEKQAARAVLLIRK